MIIIGGGADGGGDSGGGGWLCVYDSEDNLWKPVLSYHVNPRNWTWAIRLCILYCF